jgi:hypothetical protein
MDNVVATPVGCDYKSKNITLLHYYITTLQKELQQKLLRTKRSQLLTTNYYLHPPRLVENMEGKKQIFYPSIKIFYCN